MRARPLRSVLPLLLLLLPAALYDCAGPVDVTANIINDSSVAFNVTYNGAKYTSSPHSVLEIRYLAVLSSKNQKRDAKNFNCCPCKATTPFVITPVATGKTLTKDPTDPSAWTIKHNPKSVDCNFEILDSDVR